MFNKFYVQTCVFVTYLVSLLSLLGYESFSNLTGVSNSSHKLRVNSFVTSFINEAHSDNEINKTLYTYKCFVCVCSGRSMMPMWRSSKSRRKAKRNRRPFHLRRRKTKGRRRQCWWRIR